MIQDKDDELVELIVKDMSKKLRDKMLQELARQQEQEQATKNQKAGDKKPREGSNGR